MQFVTEVLPTRTIVNEFQQTYTIYIGNAYVMGYIYDGEVFSVKVPENQRRQGIAKRLLRAASALVKERTGKQLRFTKAVTKEGAALIEWWNEKGVLVQ